MYGAHSSSQILPLSPHRVHKAGKPVLPVSIFPISSAGSTRGSPSAPGGVWEGGEVGSVPLKKPRSRKAKPTADGADAESASPASMMTGNGSLQAGGVSSSIPQPMVDSEGRQVFHYEGGLSQYVAWMNEGKTKLHDPIYITR